MRPIDRHRWVDIRGNVCQHPEDDKYWVPPNWREEKERERERAEWRERDARTTTTAPQAGAWVDGILNVFYFSRRQGFVRNAHGNARDQYHFARSAVEGDVGDEDLTPGRRCRFTTEQDVGPYTDRLRVARLRLAD